MKSSSVMVSAWGSPGCWRSLDGRGPVEPALAGDDHPLGDVAQHRVGGAAERAPGTRPAGPLALLPDHLAPRSRRPRSSCRIGGDVGGQAAVGLAAQVGHVDGDPAAGLEGPGALGEHVLRADRGTRGRSRAPPPGPSSSSYCLAGEVGRRRDHQGHRCRPRTAVHVPGVAADEGLGHRHRIGHRFVVRQLRWLEAARRRPGRRGPLGGRHRNWRWRSGGVVTWWRGRRYRPGAGRRRISPRGSTEGAGSRRNGPGAIGAGTIGMVGGGCDAPGPVPVRHPTGRRRGGPNFPLTLTIGNWTGRGPPGANGRRQDRNGPGGRERRGVERQGSCRRPPPTTATSGWRSPTPPSAC